MSSLSMQYTGLCVLGVVLSIFAVTRLGMGGVLLADAFVCGMIGFIVGNLRCKSLEEENGKLKEEKQKMAADAERFIDQNDGVWK